MMLNSHLHIIILWPGPQTLEQFNIKLEVVPKSCSFFFAVLQPQKPKNQNYSSLFPVTLQNPTLGVLVMDGCNVLDSKRGSGPPKPRCEASCQRLCMWHQSGDSSVINDPFGALGSTPLYVCFPPAWGSAGGKGFNSPILVGLWTTRDLQEKMGKALAEFIFCCLGKLR
jgi:hypothetical protein